jgi:hypothetical protein
MSRLDDFIQGAQSAYAQDVLEWIHSMEYDERHDLVHFMGKAANGDSTWSHQYYDLRTGTWTVVMLSNWNNQGHIYGNLALNPETGDLFVTRGGGDFPTALLNGQPMDFPRRLRWWKWTRRAEGSSAWGQTMPTSNDYWIGGDNTLVSHMNGVACHPHLFGRNRSGVCIDNQFNTIYVNLITQAFGFTSHQDDLYGNREGCGVYWPAKNCLIMGGNRSGIGQLLKVTPNAAQDGAPVFTTLPLPPSSVGGSSWQDATALSSIFVHPNNPNKLLMLSQNTTQCWESSDAITWTARGPHPFTKMPRVGVSIPRLGIIWMQGRNAASGAVVFSETWTPSP